MDMNFARYDDLIQILGVLIKLAKNSGHPTGLMFIMTPFQKSLVAGWFMAPQVAPHEKPTYWVGLVGLTVSWGHSST